MSGHFNECDRPFLTVGSPCIIHIGLEPINDRYWWGEVVNIKGMMLEGGGIEWQITAKYTGGRVSLRGEEPVRTDERRGLQPSHEIDYAVLPDNETIRGLVDTIQLMKLSRGLTH